MRLLKEELLPKNKRLTVEVRENNIALSFYKSVGFKNIVLR